jgi:hypothetical protein
MEDWELMNLVADDPFISDELRADRDQFRRELQWKVPASVAAPLLVWWLMRSLFGVTWSAAVPLARRWFRRVPRAAQAEIVIAGKTPPDRPGQSLGDLAQGTRVADSVIRTT